jgi:hypothetical protein
MTATLLIFGGLAFLVILGSAVLFKLSTAAKIARTERQKKLVDDAMASLPPEERIAFKKEMLSKIDSALHSKEKKNA